MNSPLSKAAYRVVWSLLGVFLVFGNTARLPAAPSPLTWRTAEKRVDAQIESWTLPRLLEQIASVTGWQIFVEPEAEQTISAKFRDLPMEEALGRLLSDLNYALLPQTNASPKLFVFRTSVHEATLLVKPPDPGVAKAKAGNPIPNELVVTLKPDAKMTIDDLARSLGAKVTGRLDGLNAYRLQFANEDAASTARRFLENNDSVNAVEANYSVNRPTRTESLAASSSGSFNLKPAQAQDGKQITIGLIDTGVQSQEPRIKNLLLPGISVAGEATLPGNEPTHGTSMAEAMMRGLSLGANASGEIPVKILSVDVYGDNPSTTTFEVANGIYTAINKGANPINLSLGGEGDSPLMYKIIQDGHKQGVLFVAAAGNEPSTNPVYPAAYPEVIAATAGDKKGNIAAYANHGDFVDVVAPSSSIIYFNNNAYMVSGTSVSTAYVTGLAAGYAVKTGKPVSSIEAEIRQELSVKASAKP